MVLRECTKFGDLVNNGLERQNLACSVDRCCSRIFGWVSDSYYNWVEELNRLAYKAGYKYQVAEDFSYDTGIVGYGVKLDGFISMTIEGTLTIHAGYAWDGASGPAINTVNFRRGSLVHDALYQLIENDLLPFSYRMRADDVLIQICKEDGMSAIRRWWVKLAVNNFGARALEIKNPVQYAPEDVK